MRAADFVTVHIPKTPETTGLIGDPEFAVAKPSLRIVNASRGGIIDEAALERALAAGLIAGAALDVFVSEPPSSPTLIAQPHLQVTPHLGASTDEAQEKAGVAVARSVRLALDGELVPDAVNVAGGIIDPYVRPGIPLTEKLGQVFAALAERADREPRRRGPRRPERPRRQRAQARRAEGPVRPHAHRERLATSTRRSSRRSAACRCASSRTR